MRTNQNTDQIQAFRSQLLAWYNAHARDLPWREDRDPYRVWVSEIMLQQTRVAAVIEHYHEFLRRFPSVEKLAAAREASVLAAWSGLGYYRRARTLHAAAKVIVRERRRKFPATSTDWLELPGIGRYTAAAIASIAFNEPVAVVDGNVERVLQRFTGNGLKGEEFWDEAQAWLDPARPGDFNQAMMELGAMICTPRAPACLTCPLVDWCATRGELPVSTKVPRQHKREVHYVLHCDPDRVFLVQRPRDASLMAGMWEFPELSISPNKKQVPRSARTDKNAGLQPLFTLKHSITVTDYTVRVWRQETNGAQGKWIGVKRLRRLALTGLARKILQRANLMAGKRARQTTL